MQSGPHASPSHVLGASVLSSSQSTLPSPGAALCASSSCDDVDADTTFQPVRDDERLRRVKPLPVQQMAGKAPAQPSALDSLEATLSAYTSQNTAASAPQATSSSLHRDDAAVSAHAALPDAGERWRELTDTVERQAVRPSTQDNRSVALQSLQPGSAEPAAAALDVQSGAARSTQPTAHLQRHVPTLHDDAHVTAPPRQAPSDCVWRSNALHNDHMAHAASRRDATVPSGVVQGSSHFLAPATAASTVAHQRTALADSLAPLASTKTALAELSAQLRNLLHADDSTISQHTVPSALHRRVPGNVQHLPGQKRIQTVTGDKVAGVAAGTLPTRSKSTPHGVQQHDRDVDQLLQELNDTLAQPGPLLSSPLSTAGQSGARPSDTIGKAAANAVDAGHAIMHTAAVEMQNPTAQGGGVSGVTVSSRWAARLCC